MASPQVADGGTTSSMDAIILNKRSQAADKRCSPAWGLGEVLTLLTVITYLVTKNLQGKPRTCNNTSVRPKQRKGDTIFGTWNVRSQYRAG
jgi:hypothetical protein